MKSQDNTEVDYMNEPTFWNNKRLLVLLFKSRVNDTKRYYYCYGYYIPLVESKDFNVLIENELFFDQPIKNKQEAYEKPIEMSRNDDYTSRKLSDYSYHQKHYKVIATPLSRQRNYNYSTTD